MQVFSKKERFLRFCFFVHFSSVFGTKFRSVRVQKEIFFDRLAIEKT